MEVWSFCVLLDEFLDEALASVFVRLAVEEEEPLVEAEPLLDVEVLLEAEALLDPEAFLAEEPDRVEEPLFGEEAALEVRAIVNEILVIAATLFEPVRMAARSRAPVHVRA